MSGKSTREIQLEKIIKTQNELVRSLNHIVATLEARYSIAEQRRKMAERDAFTWWMILCPFVAGICVGGLAVLELLGK